MQVIGVAVALAALVVAAAVGVVDGLGDISIDMCLGEAVTVYDRRDLTSARTDVLMGSGRHAALEGPVIDGTIEWYMFSQVGGGEDDEQQQVWVPRGDGYAEFEPCEDEAVLLVCFAQPTVVSTSSSGGATDLDSVLGLRDRVWNWPGDTVQELDSNDRIYKVFVNGTVGWITLPARFGKLSALDDETASEAPFFPCASAGAAVDTVILVVGVSLVAVALLVIAGVVCAYRRRGGGAGGAVRRRKQKALFDSRTQPHVFVVDGYDRKNMVTNGDAWFYPVPQWALSPLLRTALISLLGELIVTKAEAATETGAGRAAECLPWLRQSCTQAHARLSQLSLGLSASDVSDASVATRDARASLPLQAGDEEVEDEEDGNVSLSSLDTLAALLRCGVFTMQQALRTATSQPPAVSLYTYVWAIDEFLDRCAQFVPGILEEVSHQYKDGGEGSRIVSRSMREQLRAASGASSASRASRRRHASRGRRLTRVSTRGSGGARTSAAGGTASTARLSTPSQLSHGLRISDSGVFR